MRRAVLSAAGAVLLAALAAGCTDDEGQAPPDATDPPPETTQPAEPTTPATTATDAPVADCEAVAAARQGIIDATQAELERLEVDRSAQEAFGITLVVSSQEAGEYWTGVRDAISQGADEQLREDARYVSDYWTALELELDQIEIADGSEASVQAALDELNALSAQAQDEEVVPAQERVQAAVDEACGTEAAPLPTETAP